MSGPSRVDWILCWVSRGVVGIWLAALLAASALERNSLGTAPRLAALEAIAEAPEPASAAESAPRREPEPVAEPEPPAPARAEPVRIGAAEVAEGSRLLGGSGAFPALSSSYERFGSFSDYARAMIALGSRLVVVRDRGILAEIELESGAMQPFAAAAPFSPRARDYGGELGLRELSRAARARHGPRAEVMLLVPHAFDATLFGGIARALRERGESHGEYREIRGSYERTPRGTLALRIEAGVRRDGTRVPLDLLFDLSELARS